MPSYCDCDFGKYSWNLYPGQTNKRTLRRNIIYTVAIQCTAFGWCIAVSFAHIFNKSQYNVRFREIPMLLRNTEIVLNGAELSGVILYRILLTILYTRY